MNLYNDNQAALSIAGDLSSVNRTKHIELKYFYIQDLVEKKKIKINFLRTENMIADLLTKALDKNKFQRFRNMILDSREAGQ